MIARIQSIEDVKVFTQEIILEGVRIHPDDDFRDMVDSKSDKPTYSDEEADIRNELMNQCFSICEREGVDIYGIMLEIFQNNIGLANFESPIPTNTDKDK